MINTAGNGDVTVVSVQLASLSPRFAQSTAYFRRFSLEKGLN